LKNKLKIYLFLLVAVCFNSLLVAQNDFVRQQDNRLLLHDEPYHFIGTNMWYANLLAMTSDKGGNRKRLLKELDFLQQQGVINIRVLIGAQGQNKMVNGVQPVHPAVQLAPATYNEDVLEGMDYLLQQLDSRKMKAVFFFSNNWEWSGGFLQYLNWHDKIDDSTLAKKYNWDAYRDIVSRFYSCNECMEDYWSFVKHVLQRTNTLTAKKYTEEAAIMAWEIANEPRPMRTTAIDVYKGFLKQTGALIKAIDPGHLLTLGTEGYMGTENMQVFQQVHEDKNVDYATIHIWPKNWGWYKDSSFKDDFNTVLKSTMLYIDDHAATMKKINKPLVIEEFGLPRDDFSFSIGSAVTYRNKYYATIMETLLQSKKKNGVIAGVNFWSFSGFGKPAKNNDLFWKEGDDLLGDPPMEEQGLNAVFSGDTSTWKLINKYVRLTR
jgi:mannan endo-1,4-beta-mannosidase